MNVIATVRGCARKRLAAPIVAAVIAASPIQAQGVPSALDAIPLAHFGVCMIAALPNDIPTEELVAAMGYEPAVELPEQFDNGEIQQAWRVAASDAEIFIAAAPIPQVMGPSKARMCHVLVTEGDADAIVALYEDLLVCADCPFTLNPTFESGAEARKYDWRLDDGRLVSALVIDAQDRPDLTFDVLVTVYSVP